LVGGILSITAGALSIVWFVTMIDQGNILWQMGANWCLVLGIILALFGVFGGLMALMKRFFPLAIIGAVCASLTIGWFGSSFVLGIVAVILVAIGKDAFDANKPQPRPVTY
jgi:hypothetical protein